MDKTTFHKIHPDPKLRPACIYCGEDDPVVLEKHHAFGKGYSDDIVLLCKNHHAKITAGQNLVAPKARSKNASPVERLVYALLSFLLLLAEGIDNLIKICYELLAVGSA